MSTVALPEAIGAGSHNRRNAIVAGMPPMPEAIFAAGHRRPQPSSPTAIVARSHRRRDRLTAIADGPARGPDATRRR